MIRSLRSRHRMIFVGLAVVVPPLFIAGLLSRETIPTQTDIPPALSVASDDTGWEAVWSDTLRDESVGIELDSRIVHTTRGRFVVFDLQTDTPIPDILAYWHPSGGAGEWKEEALLLGTVREGHTAEFPLLQAAQDQSGSLVLYSMARDEQIAVVPVPPLGGAQP